MAYYRFGSGENGSRGIYVYESSYGAMICELCSLKSPKFFIFKSVSFRPYLFNGDSILNISFGLKKSFIKYNYKNININTPKPTIRKILPHYRRKKVNIKRSLRSDKLFVSKPKIKSYMQYGPFSCDTRTEMIEHIESHIKNGDISCRDGLNCLKRDKELEGDKVFYDGYFIWYNEIKSK